MLDNDEYEFIYVPMNLLDEKTPDKFRVIVVPPVFLADCEENVKARLGELNKFGFAHVLAHTIAHIELVSGMDMKIHVGFHMNVTNSRSIEFFSNSGVSDVVLSQEITLKRAEKLISSVPLGIIAYGRQSLMTLRRCPISNGKPCNNGKKCGEQLFDRMGNEIPTICSNTVELLNPDCLYLSDKMSDISFLDFIVLRFTTEDDTQEIFELYERGRKPDGKLTRGLYYRGVE